MSLDRAHEILSWRPIVELDPLRLSLWAQVWRVIFMIGVKAHLDGGARARSCPRARPAARSRSARARPAWQEAITARRSRTGKTAGERARCENYGTGSRKLRLIVSPVARLAERA
jgi:hypothetical protein